MSLFGYGLLGFIPGLQGMEWVILIVIVVVLLFGAKKLPELARSVGRATGEFQRGKDEIEKEIKAAREAIISTDSTKPAEPSMQEKEIDRLIKVAKELGIETEGKTETELREEISKAMMR